MKPSTGRKEAWAKLPSDASAVDLLKSVEALVANSKMLGVDPSLVRVDAVRKRRFGRGWLLLFGMDAETWRKRGYPGVAPE